MPSIATGALLAFWVTWGYPFIFRAPHNQKRHSITALAPTRVGLLLECIAISIAFAFRLPQGSPPGAARILPAFILGTIATALAWSAVRHLGRQFRIHAGLYDDHQLVRTGAYAVVRHPIYSSLLAMLLCSLLILTRWPWAMIAVVVFIAGTEIRVRTEDRLLASRFGAEFEAYRSEVPAYLPFVR
jgi:protein-S-isoprenylcysteine O-methyltransferase Ste14